MTGGEWNCRVPVAPPPPQRRAQARGGRSKFPSCPACGRLSPTSPASAAGAGGAVCLRDPEPQGHHARMGRVRSRGSAQTGHQLDSESQGEAAGLGLSGGQRPPGWIPAARAGHGPQRLGCRDEEPQGNPRPSNKAARRPVGRGGPGEAGGILRPPLLTLTRPVCCPGRPPPRGTTYSGDAGRTSHWNPGAEGRGCEQEEGGPPEGPSSPLPRREGPGGGPASQPASRLADAKALQTGCPTSPVPSGPPDAVPVPLNSASPHPGAGAAPGQTVSRQASGGPHCPGLRGAFAEAATLCSGAQRRGAGGGWLRPGGA